VSANRQVTGLAILYLSSYTKATVVMMAIGVVLPSRKCVSLGRGKAESTATAAITNNYSLHQNLAELPPVPTLTPSDLPLPEDAETAAYSQRSQFTADGSG
jgi:hypothetical protein